MAKVIDLVAWLRRRSEREGARGMVVALLPCGCQVGWLPGSPPVTECPAHVALDQHPGVRAPRT